MGYNSLTHNEMVYKIEKLKSIKEISPNEVFDIFVFFIENSKHFHGINKGEILRENSPDGYSFGAADLGTGDIAVFNNRIDRIVAIFNEVAKTSGLHATGTILATIIQMSEHEVEHLVQRESILGKRIHPDALQFAKEYIAMIKAYDDYYVANSDNIIREQDGEIVGYYRAIDVLKIFLPEAVNWFQEAYRESINCSLGHAQVKLDFKYNNKVIPIDAPSNITATKIADIVIAKEPEYLQMFPILQREYHLNGTRKSYEELMKDEEKWISDLVQNRMNRDIVFAQDKKYTTIDAIDMLYDNIIKSSPELQRQKEFKKILLKYDDALYGNYGQGVIFVIKNGLYGVINLKGEEIVSCEYKEYSDAYDEWRDTGFSIIKTPEDFVKAEMKKLLKETRQQLIQSGDIKEFSFYNDRTVNGAVFVKLANGDIGIAASVIGYDGERDKQLEITNSNGEHIIFISEPELIQGIGTPHLKICTDNNNLYVGSYGNEYSFLACYRMGDFERVWKTSLPGSRIQSITVNDDNVIAFDMGLYGDDGRIKYFDKQTGEHEKGKDIITKKQNENFTVNSHHNIAATSESLFAVVPGLSFGINSGLPEFDNEIKRFDNASGEMVNKKSVSINVGTLNAIAIDEIRGRAYLALDDKIGVFSNNGYEGMLLAPTRNIMELDFDKQTGCLMISMKDGRGKTDIYSPQAIETLLQTSKQLNSNQEITGKLPIR